MMNRNFQLLAIALLCVAGFGAEGQPAKKAPYYVSLNDASDDVVHEIADFMLNLTYNDVYGQSKESLIYLYDWKRTAVATFKVDKAYGLNSYSIRLDDVYSGWQEDQLYTCEMKDEENNIYRLPIRIVPPPVMEDPEVSILVNPVHIACDGLSSNLVEFYGMISGGKAPYTINWFVLNDKRSDFLYQPREEVIPLAGSTPVIKVDRNPEYYVVLYVRDACGGEQKRIVNLVCEKGRKKINSVFLEELQVPAMKGVKPIN